MNNGIIFRIVLAAVFVGFIAHRAYYTRKSTPSNDSVEIEREDSLILKLTGFLSIFALLATVVYIAYPPAMAWASLSLPDWVRWLGLGIALAGFALLQWSQITLGKNWSDIPVLLKEHKLVQEGPYRWVRHPIYTAFLLILGSYGLLAANWFILIAWLSMSIIDIWMRIQFEEKLMLDQFGDNYAVYMRQTGRLLPYL